MRVLNVGSAEGVVMGGNLGSFYLLQGTPYMPEFRESTILAIEDDDEAGRNTAREFDRRLESILEQPGARDNIVGVVVGRFQKSSGISDDDVEYILRAKFNGSIPVIYNVGFGHTSPLATMPVGGKLRIVSDSKKGVSIYGLR